MSDPPQSPPKDVEQAAQSPEDDGQLNEAQEAQVAMEYEGVKEQDRWLPIANDQKDEQPSKPDPLKENQAKLPDANIRNLVLVARIMKNALPENAKIAKEAKECMQECVSEFISFITSEASEKCQQEKRKTVNGEDILFAMTSLGFENYAEALKVYLSKYREQQNQTNRDRVMETNPWGSTVSAERTEASANNSEFPEGSSNAEGNTEGNFS